MKKKIQMEGSNCDSAWQRETIGSNCYARLSISWVCMS